MVMETEVLTQGRREPLEVDTAMVLVEGGDETYGGLVPATSPQQQHYRPTIRLCKVDKQQQQQQGGSCGFHLTRTKWDPYPWVAAVDQYSAAQQSGLKVGDCVLEVNGDDVIGLRINQIASKIKTCNVPTISMLVWNAGIDPKCNSESLCCCPMPTSLSRLSSCLSSILSFVECPVCFELITPPAQQCPIGHLICLRCRVCIDRCPICRTEFTNHRSLLADQIYNSIIEAFHLKNQPVGEQTFKLWERIFGRAKQKSRDRQPTAARAQRYAKNGSRNGGATDFKTRFLNRLIGKSTSVDNLAQASTSITSTSMFTPALRKKSISSTEIYPESLKRLHHLYESNRNSSESLVRSARSGDLHSMMTSDTALLSSSRFSSTNSFDIFGSRTFLHQGNRPRSRNMELGAPGTSTTENLFQFSSTPNTASTSAGDPSQNHVKYFCPISSACTPLTTYSLLTHLREHDGPLIQYFKSRFSIRFPLSFGDTAVVIAHCYQKSFFLRIHVDEDSQDVKMCIALMGDRNAALNYKLKVKVRGRYDFGDTDLKFKSRVHPLVQEMVVDGGTYDEDAFKYQIVITNSTLLVYFQDNSYTVDLNIKEY